MVIPRRLIYGVGINDADYPTQRKNPYWKCPYLQRWKCMLERCYSTKFHLNRPTYIGCGVCEDWKTFSNFRKWLISQEELHGSLDGLHLDKDIIDPDNKIYSPDKCAFVSGVVNTFVTDRGEYPLGVCLRPSGRYQSQCGNPFIGEQITLGTFNTPEEAHEAWRNCKHGFACQLADIVKDVRVAEALRLRYR